MPAPAQAMYEGAVEHLHAGRLVEAGDYCQKALRCDPHHGDSLHVLGVIATRRSSYDLAIRHIGKAILINDRNATYHNSLGNVFHQQGRLDEAVGSYRRATALRPAFAQAHANLGNALQAKGDLDAAIECLRRAIALKPNFAEFHAALGGALLAQRALEEAAASYINSIALKPDNACGYFHLGNVLREQGQLDEAILTHRKAVELNPEYVEAFTNLGNELQDKGSLEEAIACYRRAIAFQPDYAEAYNNLGNALGELGRVEEAMLCHRKTIELKPDNAAAYNNLGNELQEQGRLDEAWQSYETAVRLEPRRGVFYHMLVSTGRVGADSPYFERMKALAADIDTLPADEQIYLHFALGNVYGASGQPALSFRHQLAGNRLKRSGIPYDEPGTMAALSHLRGIFTREMLAEGRQFGIQSRLPVFVVGMPRSGTTLVEQILASHPQIHGAGELMDLPIVLGSQTSGDGVTNFDDALAAMRTGGLGALGTAYLDKLRACSPAATRIVDKLPDNFMRIGFLHMAMPQARIIHVRRDPIDTCLSCYSKLFVGMLPYAYDLGELGRYYRAYETLMAHWREVLPAGIMLEVRYEDLVADLDGQARRILAHCDVPWDDLCLSFHKTQRSVKTASVIQVRKPLYGSSVGRWHVYADLARPLFDALGL